MIKIGYMDYANVYPIFHHLLKHSNFSFVRGVPSLLNTAIREGAIDVSPSSSIEFARYPSYYKIIPDISISSIGEVKSVNLFSALPIEQLDNKRIMFTKESNTSTVLCKIILEKFYNIKPVYCCEDGCDAELLIGDKALHKYYNNNYKYVYDLGKLWHEHTKLPFVFALWICRADIGVDDEMRELMELLRKYSAKTNEYSKNIINQYTKLGYTDEQMLDYWNIIDYKLSVKHIEGLSLFYKYAYEMGETSIDATNLLTNSFLI